MQPTIAKLTKTEVDQSLVEAQHPEFHEDHAKKAEKPEIEYQYTSLFCNQKPSLNGARTVILCVFFVIGAISSYQAAIVLDLQEKKATFDDQANFSFSGYPYLFKIIFAPFIDIYFIKKIGKCKTWIVTASIVLFILLLLMAPHADSLVDSSKIGTLTLLWFCINLVAVFMGIAAEMFIVKIFEADDKSKGSMLLDMGWTIGGFFSYNLFVPFNSVHWLNTYIYTSNPRTQPLVSHQAMVIFLAVATLTYGVLVFLFVGEKMIEDHLERPSFHMLFRRIVRFFTKETMRNFLVFILMMRIFRSFVVDTIGLKFITHGIPKTTIVNIDTVTFPLYVFCSILFMRFMVKGKIMKWYNWMMIYTVLLIFASFLALKDLESLERSQQGTGRTTWFLIILSILGRFCVEGPFMMGFINLITPEEIGSTFITFMMCWMNLSYALPATLGLKVTHTKIFNFDYQVIVALSIQLLMVFVYMSYCNNLDTKEKEE